MPDRPGASHTGRKSSDDVVTLENDGGCDAM